MGFNFGVIDYLVLGVWEVVYEGVDMICGYELVDVLVVYNYFLYGNGVD